MSSVRVCKFGVFTTEMSLDRLVKIRHVDVSLFVPRMFFQLVAPLTDCGALRGQPIVWTISRLSSDQHKTTFFIFYMIFDDAMKMQIVINKFDCTIPIMWRNEAAPFNEYS